jgi:hypothetical protein
VLEAKVAETVRTSADRIRERVKKTVEYIMEVGDELLAVKEALEHGQFGPWLKAKFRWSERTAQSFMSVAERFKSAKIADLPIQASAAYFLAAPSVPDEARQVAVEKAEAGQEITVATAREIVAEAKKKRRPRRQKAVPADKLGVRLIKMLRRYQERWPGELSELARHLREFTDALDMRSKKKARG